MNYYILKNVFAPKINSFDEKIGMTNSHAVLVNYCNFKCTFCGIDYAGKKRYVHYFESDFEKKIIELMEYGKNFKFSGGEPTLNPELKNSLRIVKKHGGVIFLDTNGSKPDIVKELLEEKLVDVLGVSLKGVDSDSAKQLSGVADSKVSWDNPIKSILLGVENDVKVIVTLVVFSTSTPETINAFAKLFKPGKVVLKINNYKKGKECGLYPMPSEKLVAIMQDFVENNLQWKGNVVLINSSEAVGNYQKILFF